MSITIDGARVTRVASKTFEDSGKTFWSFKVDKMGDKFLRGNENRYAGVMEEGNVVDIQATEKGNNIVISSALLSQRAAMASQSQAAPKAAGGAGPTTSYVDTRQASIEYQSARNAAISFIDLLRNSGALVLPKAQSGQVKAIEAMLDKYTAAFYGDMAGLGAIARAEGKVAPAAKEEEDLTDGE